MMLRRIFALCCLVTQVHAADVALVDDELGQALLFSNRGLCYAVLPNHVSATRNRISLAIPAPAEVGSAEIFWRDPENDLALAYVESTLGNRCQVDLNDLGGDNSNMLQSTATGMIKSVHFGGAFFDRIGAAMVDVDDSFITVRITDTGIDAEAMQGLSGAVLTAGNRFVGIAIDAETTQSARFLRMERISALIRANLSTDHPDNRAVGESTDGKGFRVTSFEGGDKAGVISLEPGSLTAPWIANWTGEPISFEITLSNDTLVELHQVVMGSVPGDQTTSPRRIALSIDRGLSGNPYWTDIATPDMSPTGVFEVSTGGTVARRLRIRILDVWHSDRPIRLDRLTIN